MSNFKKYYFHICWSVVYFTIIVLIVKDFHDISQKLATLYLWMTFVAISFDKPNEDTINFQSKYEAWYIYPNFLMVTNYICCVVASIDLLILLNSSRV